MKNITRMPLFLTCFLLLWIGVSPCHSQELSLERIGEFGFIDWLSHRAYAKGVGIYPQNRTNEAQAKAMAQRAALVVAQRNLLGVIKGVHIDSTTVIENRMARDDTIVARIEGLVQYCRVEGTRMIDETSVEVSVSMPILGKLGEVLIHLIEEADGRAGAFRSPDVEQRLSDLESRVRLLENRLSDLKQISVNREDLLRLLQQLSLAWQTHSAALQPLISSAGYASDAETAAIRAMLNDQEKRLASLSVHLDDLAGRLSTLESKLAQPGAAVPSQPSPQSPYTGLIVDARNTGFKPCLKPGIFIDGKAIYPGDYLDLEKAVAEGYVRYYADPKQAQHSDRIGTLPYVVTATGTYGGDRGLALDAGANAVLQSVLQSTNHFLAQARVVIIIGRTTD